MADLNKVFLIGRLTSNPEIRTFPDGGKMATFGFAVNNRRKNRQTGEWEKNVCFIDCKCNNRETGRKLADTAEMYLGKGDSTHLEGHLVLDEWVGKEDGKKQSRLRVMVDEITFLEPKKDVKPVAPKKEEETNFDPDSWDLPF